MTIQVKARDKVLLPRSLSSRDILVSSECVVPELVNCREFSTIVGQFVETSPSFLGRPATCLHDVGAKASMIHISGRGERPHHEIDVLILGDDQIAADMTKPPAHPVPLHRIADGFTHDQTEPRSGRPLHGGRVCFRMHDDAGTPRTNAKTHDGTKVGRHAQAVREWQHSVALFGLAGHGLGRQLRATLAATTCNDRASCTRAHAETEAMRLGTATVIRLVGPLALGHGVLLR